MEMAKITINGQAINAPTGSTVLEAAKQAGIDIPTLCNHPALIPIGACRVCLVEVKGQRNLQPACTFPIMDGMEVETETPLLIKARKFILDMIFSERNHYCMYCEMSGKCELQNLGYRYGLDHFIYPTYMQAFPVDATNQYFIMEHNRCVLCWRCIRACAELPANHTLGLGQRGANSMIRADANVPLGSSSCVSCGSCVQVCPTGALLEKHSAFTGRDALMTYTKSTCSQCSIGCGMTVVTRGNDVQRIESDWESPVSGGRLCRKGRFEPLYDNRKRLAAPLIKRNGKLQAASWDEALQMVADRIGNGDAGQVGAMSATSATNEALYLLGQLFRQAPGSGNIGLLSDATAELSGKPSGTLAELAGSDLILVVGGDPAQNQPVASFYVKRAIDRGARLVVVNDQETGLSPFASQNLALADIGQAVEMAGRAVCPAVLFGSDIPAAAVEALKGLAEKAAMIALEPGVNTYAAKSLGFHNGFRPSALKLLYLLLGEDKGDEGNILKNIDKNAFVVVQAGYASALTERADVVLPTAIWSERDGTLTNTEGRIQKVGKAVTPPGEAKPDWEVLALLADKLGKKLGASFEDISAQAVREIKGKEM